MSRCQICQGARDGSHPLYCSRCVPSAVRESRLPDGVAGDRQRRVRTGMTIASAIGLGLCTLWVRSGHGVNAEFYAAGSGGMLCLIVMVWSIAANARR